MQYVLQILPTFQTEPWIIGIVFQYYEEYYAASKPSPQFVAVYHCKMMKHVLNKIPETCCVMKNPSSICLFGTMNNFYTLAPTLALENLLTGQDWVAAAIRKSNTKFVDKVLPYKD